METQEASYSSILLLFIVVHKQMVQINTKICVGIKTPRYMRGCLKSASNDYVSMYNEL